MLSQKLSLGGTLRPPTVCRTLQQTVSMSTVSIYQSYILGSPVFCQKLVKDRPEINDKLQPEPTYPVDYISDYWACPPNGCPSEDLSAPIAKPIINTHTIQTESTYKQPSSINIILDSHEKSQGYTEDNYLPLTQSHPIIQPSSKERRPG